ncbi:MAG: hypothetical protein JKY70_18135 [Mucilaginibacter sp.]|nr:hypothetical protein [Mucilaginibacter sp.]
MLWYKQRGAKTALIIVFLGVPAAVFMLFTVVFYHSQYYFTCWLNLISIGTLTWLYVKNIQGNKPLSILYLPTVLATIFIVFYFNLHLLSFKDRRSLKKIQFDKDYSIVIDTATNDYTLSRAGIEVSSSGELGTDSMLLFATTNILVPIIVNVLSSKLYDLRKPE